MGKLDVLLIQLSSNPYFDMMSSYRIGQLGLYYLASYADKAGYNVKVKYYDSFDNVSFELPELINECQCKIVGFYVDMENIWAIRLVTSVIKKKCPDVQIIAGGPQITGDPIGSLQTIPHLLCGIIGEGEIPFVKLLQTIEYNEDSLKKINSLIFFDSKGEIVTTQLQKQSTNLDEYGFPLREKYCLDPEKISFSQIISGRGCMGQCAFCYEGGLLHTNLRVRSIDSCLDEIDYLVKQYKVKYINFVDDTFILNKNRTEHFCNEMIRKYDGRVKWYCEARADILSRNIDLLPLMKRAGLVKIQLGGESGNQKVLDAYKKSVTLQQMEYVTKKIAEADIPYIYVNYIIGGAFETEQTFEDTLTFAKKLMRIAPGRVEVSSSVFTPTPGSPMYTHPELFGLKVIDKRAIRGANCSFVFAETKELNQYKIWQLRNKFNNEIDKEYSDILDSTPISQIKRIYELSIRYEIDTPYSALLKKKANYRNYFEPIVRGGFCSFSEIPEDDVFSAIPLRTTHLSSDGLAFYRINRSGEYVKNSNLENALITLSAGKLTFGEIFSIIKRNPAFTAEKDNMLEECLSIYKEFDRELSIIWKNDGF